MEFNINFTEQVIKDFLDCIRIKYNKIYSADNITDITFYMHYICITIDNNHDYFIPYLLHPQTSGILRGVVTNRYYD